jgi:hypothetical protein
MGRRFALLIVSVALGVAQVSLDKSHASEEGYNQPSEVHMAQEKSFRVRLLLPSLEAIHGLAVDSDGMPMRRRQDGQIEMEAIIPQSTLGKLRRMKRRNVFVEILAGPGLADADREALTMVSRTNRYADGSLPRGLGSRKD